MKTEIIEYISKKETPDFPALYRNEGGELVLLLWAKGKGVVLISKNVCNSVGMISEDWRMDNLIKITTSITIKFEA